MAFDLELRVHVSDKKEARTVLLRAQPTPSEDWNGGNNGSDTRRWVGSREPTLAFLPTTAAAAEGSLPPNPFAE